MAPITGTQRKDSVLAMARWTAALAASLLFSALPAAALGEPNPKLTVEGAGIGLGLIVVPDPQSGTVAVSLCWYFTSGTEMPPAGPDDHSGGYVVYFPFVDTAPYIEYVSGSWTATVTSPNGEGDPKAQADPNTFEAPPAPNLAVSGVGTQHAGTAPSCNDTII